MVDRHGRHEYNTRYSPLSFLPFPPTQNNPQKAKGKKKVHRHGMLRKSSFLVKSSNDLSLAALYVEILNFGHRT